VGGAGERQVEAREGRGSVLISRGGGGGGTFSSASPASLARKRKGNTIPFPKGKRHAPEKKKRLCRTKAASSPLNKQQKKRDKEVGEKTINAEDRRARNWEISSPGRRIQGSKGRRTSLS